MAATIPFSIGAAADLTNRAINKIWLKVKDEGFDYYKKYMYVETGITDYEYKDSALSDLGNAGRVLENAVIGADSPIQGFDKTLTQVTYGKLLRITKRMYSLILHPILATICKKLRKLRENPNSRTIRSQVGGIKKSPKGSETIIGALITT